LPSIQKGNKNKNKEKRAISL